MIRRFSNSTADPGLPGDRASGWGHRLDPVEIGLAVLGVLVIVLIGLFKVLWLTPSTIGQSEPPTVEATAELREPPRDDADDAAVRGLRLRDVPHLLAPAVSAILSPAAEWLAAEFDGGGPTLTDGAPAAPDGMRLQPPPLLEWRSFDLLTAPVVGGWGSPLADRLDPDGSVEVIAITHVAETCERDIRAAWRFVCVAPTSG